VDGLAGPAPARRSSRRAGLDPKDLSRRRPQPRLLPQAPGLDGLRPGRADRGRVRLQGDERVPVVRGAQPARPPGQPLPGPREGLGPAGAARRPGRGRLRGRDRSRRGASPEALCVRRGRGDARHPAGLGGAGRARRRRVALALPRLRRCGASARGGPRGNRGPPALGRGRPAPDEPPQRPGEGLQRRHGPVSLRHERGRPLRRAAHAPVPDALPPTADDRVVPAALGTGPGLYGGRRGGGASGADRGRARRRVPPAAVPVYCALEVSA
jgi:hypothetical protein